jgi:ATP-dependent RNA helicase RhlE
MTNISLTATQKTIAETDILCFKQIGLAPALSRAVEEMGYETMTPIQQKAIPLIMKGHDIMGAAQTGTGKTAAFALPLLHRLMKYESTSTSPAKHPIRALILLPTRELADQVAQQIKLFEKFTGLRSCVVFGGMDIRPQIAELKQGVEILVATPGRLLDHIEGKSVLLNQVEYVVLDEADRMLDIGFLPDLQRILTHLPPQRTTILFSATFSQEIKKLSSSYLQNPVLVEVARSNATASTIKQSFYRVTDDTKRTAIVKLIKDLKISQAFIFVNSKVGCGRLMNFLEKGGFQVGSLHGDKSQDERLKTLVAFKSGEIKFLTCTDVAARGLDIKDIPVVINYDLPFNAEDYIHRIGRTGRAGAAGQALSFVGDGPDIKLLADIEKIIGQKSTFEPLNLPQQRIEPFTPHHTGRRRYQEGDYEYVRERYIDRNVDHHAKDRPARRPFPVDDAFFNQPYEAKTTTNSHISSIIASDNNFSSSNSSSLFRARFSNTTRSQKDISALLKPFRSLVTEENS